MIIIVKCFFDYGSGKELLKFIINHSVMPQKAMF